MPHLALLLIARVFFVCDLLGTATHTVACMTRSCRQAEALQEARSDDYICYNEGYLEQHVAKQMMKLYDHVILFLPLRT